jgi:hypothetical protein
LEDVQEWETKDVFVSSIPSPFSSSPSTSDSAIITWLRIHSAVADFSIIPLYHAAIT